MRAAVAYICAAVIFGVLDFLWLSNAGARLYRPAIGELMADQVRWLPALIFYGIYLVGITVFATLPALKENSVFRALRSGTLFGMSAYATYDLTNQATLRVWPTHLTLIDIAWGTFATATASVAAVLVTRSMVK